MSDNTLAVLVSHESIASSMSEYECLTVNELKKKLAQRGAVTTGRKSTLIERLEAYDRNADFRGPQVELPSSTLPHWPASGFKQLTMSHRNSFPVIKKSLIDGYFKYRQVSDMDSAEDSKAIVKGQKLLDGHRVEACSFVKQADAVFFTNIVRAAMKKKVTYSTKLKVNLHGEIINSHCECPSGKGPHGTCKHIAAVLLMLQHFTESGTLQLSGSCTDKLQTFHKPKGKYTGSPSKSSNLGKRKRCDDIDDDPRPHKYRNMSGYGDMVRAKIINFCAAHNKDICLRYLYKGADLQAAVLDHGYTTLPWTEHWVDQANKVTPQDIENIEASTRGQASDAAWFMEREWRITASRFGDILKATPRRNMDKLCASLLKAPKLCNPAVVHGKLYEQVAIEEFEQLSKLQVRPSGLFVCQGYPFLAASPDGLISDDAVLEVKCPYTDRDDKICPGPKFPFLENSDGHIKLKSTHKYFAQVQGQLYISGRKTCHFVVFTLKDILSLTIDVDEDYCNLHLIPRLELFYQKYYRKYIAKTI